MTQSATTASGGQKRRNGTGPAWRAAQIVTVTAVLGLLGLLVYDVSHSAAGHIASSVDSGTPVPAYPFKGRLVGKPGTLSLGSLRGKVVVLNFWQSYCPPCTHEAPVVSAVSKQWAGKNVVFVGVDELDLSGPATAFMRRFHITYPVISDDGPLIGHYGVTGYPETFFIDKRGEVIPMPATDCQSGSDVCQVGHIIGAATTATLDAGIKARARPVRRLLALAGAAALLLAAGSGSAAVKPRASVLALEAELICVQCHEPLDMSTSPLALQMKADIRRFVAKGWTNRQIENYFIAAFGEQVLATPPTHGFNLLAWVIPFVLVAVGLVAVCVGAWYWSRNRSDDDEDDEIGEPRFGSAPEPPLTPALDLRVDQELARFDA